MTKKHHDGQTQQLEEQINQLHHAAEQKIRELEPDKHQRYHQARARDGERPPPPRAPSLGTCSLSDSHARRAHARRAAVTRRRARAACSC